MHDNTKPDGLESVASVIEEAMQMISAAIENHCPTIYPTETDKTEGI